MPRETHTNRGYTSLTLTLTPTLTLILTLTLTLTLTHAYRLQRLKKSIQKTSVDRNSSSKAKLLNLRAEAKAIREVRPNTNPN